MTIQSVILALWLALFSMVCITIARAVRERARECRQAERRTLRRYTRENFIGLRRRRHSSAFSSASLQA